MAGVSALPWFLEYVGYLDLRLPDLANTDRECSVRSECQTGNSCQACSTPVCVVCVKFTLGGTSWVLSIQGPPFPLVLLIPGGCRGSALGRGLACGCQPQKRLQSTRCLAWTFRSILVAWSLGHTSSPPRAFPRTLRGWLWHCRGFLHVCWPVRPPGACFAGPTVTLSVSAVVVDLVLLRGHSCLPPDFPTYPRSPGRIYASAFWKRAQATGMDCTSHARLVPALLSQCSLWLRPPWAGSWMSPILTTWAFWRWSWCRWWWTVRSCSLRRSRG